MEKIGGNEEIILIINFQNSQFNSNDNISFCLNIGANWNLKQPKNGVMSVGGNEKEVIYQKAELKIGIIKVH